MELNERGAGIFFNVAQTNGQGRAEKDIIQPRCFYVDMDADKSGETDPFGWLEFYNDSVVMQPSLVTQTSVTNLHFYFLISDMPPLADMPKGLFKSIQTRAAELYFGDPGLSMTPVGVMRLPGFLNWKGAPFLVRVHQVSDIEPYTFEWAASLFATLKPDAGGATKPAEAEKKGPYKQPSVVYEGNRHKAMTKFAGWRRGRPNGDDDDQLLAAMLAFNECFDPMLSEATIEKKWANYCRTFEQWEGEPPLELPSDMFLMPNAHMPYPEAAKHIFQTIAESENMFLHGNVVSEKAPTGLEPLHPVSFQSRVDTYGKRVMHFIMIKGTPEKRLVPTRCSRGVADVLLRTKETKLLPPVLVVAAAPIITAEGQTLGQGYHRISGGVIVEGGAADAVPLDKAVAGLLALFDEFDFISPSDLSRAVAMTLTPALKTAGLLSDPTPIYFVEADFSQAGKGFLLKLLYAIYNEAPYTIAQRKNGVGSLDESFSTALLSGRQFILLDNIRGELDSCAVESMLTDPANVSARKPRFAEARVDASRVSLAVTANDMQSTCDLANRSCTTRIKKKPLDYQFKEFPEGDLLAHVAASQGRYLGCVHSIVREWIRRDRPLSGRSGHDMRLWARALDYIVTEIVGLEPLMTGHIAIQARVSNPSMVWLRAVCETLESCVCLAGDIADAIAAASIPWPSKAPASEDRARMQVGLIMKKLFRDRDTIPVDRFTVTRFTEESFNKKQGRTFTLIKYRIEDATDEAPDF